LPYSTSNDRQVGAPAWRGAAKSLVDIRSARHPLQIRSICGRQQ
jgi:hypothetical protein